MASRHRYGAPYIELDGTSMIQSSQGYLTTITYSGKGWVSGKAHSFTAAVTKNGSHSALYTITGTWTGESNYSKGPRDGQLFLNAAGPTNPVEVKPVDEQGEYESRKAWKAVADGIKKGQSGAHDVYPRLPRTDLMVDQVTSRLQVLPRALWR